MKQTVYTLLYLLALLLSVPQTVAAQEKATQDALYVFRNDGGFNAFFYRDIDHFEYSKVDTFGVEHDDYITQEIHTPDSIFRIPISAIDSVAFVTPETKYMADAFVANANLVNYVIASDSSTWFRVKSETPSNLLPKVGDKLLIEQSCDLLPGGFSGKVTAVDQAADGITVRTERISLTEVYEQYVWKFDGSQFDPESDARTRANDDATNVKGKVKGSLSLSGARTLAKANVGPWESKLTGEGSGSLGYEVGWDLDVRAFLHVSMFTGVQFDGTLKGNLTGDFNLEMQCALTSSFEQKIKYVKFHGSELSVGVFLSLSAAIGISSEWKTEGDVYGLAYLHDYPEDSNDKKDVSITGKMTKSELNILNGNVGKLSASTGVFAKAEFNVSGNNLTLRTELGASVGIDHEINLSDVANLNAITIPPAVIFYPADLYKAMDRDASLSSNAFFNASIAYEVGKYEGTFKPVDLIFFENSKTGGWVPHVEGTAFKRDKALQYQGDVSTSLSRKHLFDGIIQPIEVGYLTLDEKQNVIDNYWASYYDGKTSMSRTLDMLDPDAFYSVIPQVKLWGISMLTSDSVKVTLGPTKFDIAQRQVDVGRKHGYKDLAIDSNIKNLTFTSKADWLKCEETHDFNYDDDSVIGRELSLEWEDMPDDVYDRRARIDIIGNNQKGDVILEDSVIVVQHEDVLEFTPQSIEAEAQGGTFTVNITKTNLKDLSVSTESDFCEATLKDNVVTVTVKPNTSAEERYASVVIKGKNAADKETSNFIPISQASGSEVNPGEVSAAALQFLNTIEEISTLFRVGSWHENDFYVDGEKYISHSYYSGDGRWDNSKDKYDVEDTIMIADINDPEDPHYGMYMISAVHHEVGSNFSWYNNRDRYATIQFFISPTTEDNHGEILDVSIYTKWLETDDPEYYVIKTYNIAKVPYYKTYMRGDGVTNNYRDTEWMADAKRGTLSEGISSYMYSSNSNYENPEYNADYESCSIWIYFKNTIEAPDDDGD